jgi:fluoroquinolone resistance protein
MKLKNTIWKNCSMEEVNFQNADITESIFENCNLGKSIFMNTNLENTNLCSAYNFSIHPEKNKIKKAKFSLS